MSTFQRQELVKSCMPQREHFSISDLLMDSYKIEVLGGSRHRAETLRLFTIGKNCASVD